MRHTQKSKLSPSLGCIQILKNGKRKSTSVSLYSIQTEKLFTLWSFGVPMKTAGNTGVALQGLAKYCLNVFVAYNWKWNIFVDLWHVWTHEVLWWFYNLNSHGNYLQRGTASHNYIETDLSVLTMTFWDTRKNCWYVASCYHWCHVNRQAMGGNLCWFSSWLSYKSGRREYSFFYSAGPILPTELLCILLCRFWWVVVNLWVRGLDFCCLWSVSLVILRLTYSIHLGRSVASTPGPWVGVTLGSAARYAYPALDASPVC